MTAVDPVVVWIASFTIAMVFAPSAIIKFADLEEFRGAVANYRLLPGFAEPLAAWAIPTLEFVGAAAILARPTRFAGFAILIALLCFFSGAIVINLARGRRDIDCGCFGPGLRQELSWWLVARNFALMLTAMLAILPSRGRTLAAADLITIGFAAASILILYAAVNFLLANAPKVRVLVTENA